MKVPTNYHNPFITGQPALGSDFFGHSNILHNVQSFLKNDKLAHFFVFGKRRSGKTSLLKFIHNNVASADILPIYINLQDKADFSQNELALFFSKKIVSKLAFDFSFSENYNAIQFIEELLPKISEKNKIILFLLDEFDVFCEEKSSERKNKLIDFLHKASQKSVQNKIPFKLIIAAGENYRSEIQNKCAAFAGSGEKYYISDFNKKTTQALLQLSEPKITFGKKAIKKIYQYTGGNPYFTQCLAYKVYDAAEQNKSRHISEKMIKWQFAPTIKVYGSGAEVIWHRLADFHKIILYFAALNKSNFSAKLISSTARKKNINIQTQETSTALIKLKESNFLKEINCKKYKFSIEFFRKWIILYISKSEIETIYKNLTTI